MQAGHLHPLLVHLPIGILLLAFGLECLARWQGRSEFRPAIRFALGAGTVSAVCTAATGWWLAGQGGYEEGLLQQHRWLGMAATALALLSWWAQDRRWYLPVFAAGVVVLTLAGHFGGSLTHGEGYLFEKTSDREEGKSSGAPDAGQAVFSALVQPVLQKKCVSCHGPAKQKGNLRLDTPEGIRRGGKHGALLDVADKLLLKRLNLPLHDDDHMPPAGKPQLSDAERALLEWWIGQGADFQVKIKDAALPASLQTLLQPAETVQNPVFKLEQAEAPAAAVGRLGELFVRVSKLGENSPWLAVSFAGLPHPGPERWAALKKIAPQTTDLDLAHTDALGTELNDFTHLTRLNLAHTGATDALGPVLARMPYLEMLNLTGTRVSEAVLAPLAKLPHLRSLYLWQTDVPAAAADQFQQQNPQVRVETGAVPADTTRLALRVPTLQFGRTFFPDTLHVSLEYPSIKGVSLYYTLDEAASPTTRSEVYREKIVLNRTAHLRAFAAKDGWLNSPVIEGLFVKKQVTPVSAELKMPPSPKYPAKGAPSLIDGKIADVQGADTWLGFEGEHLSASLDLGKVQPVSTVFVHCLENNVAWIFKPAGIQIETSVDGKVFRPATIQRFPANPAMGDSKTHLLACPLGTPQEARYIRVRVESLLKNPAWHPGKGQKCWIFIDELVVE